MSRRIGGDERKNWRYTPDTPGTRLTPDPRVPSLALSRSQLKPASRHRPLAQAAALLAQAAAARTSRRRSLKPPPLR